MHVNYQTKGAILFAAITLLGCAAPVWASTDSEAELTASDVRGIQRKIAPNEITLNGRTIFRVPVGSGALSASERAAVIRERLEEIATHFVIGSDSVTVTQNDADTFVVAVGGETVASIEPRLARASGATSAETLALHFANVLRQTLSQTGARQVALMPRMHR